MEPPDVNDLLKMAPPEDDCWQMYAKGCVKGLNQVEKPGTSSRVAKYAPKNISEMCAFVAAIRPGFRSMASTFESRKPFDYGVKQFDDLIQTEEMPNSFLLYQEHLMTVLNYAGIPMSECYTAIKNIAKKRTEKVLAYKDKFISGLTAAIIADGKTESEAKKTSTSIWQIIEDSASYLFNASHSYCVSLDSLYSAWIKAHYPLAFYETLLQITESKGDKDKLVEIKHEAEDYFNITFPSFKFGQDNRAIRANLENNSISNSLTSIKNMPKATPELLWQVAQTKPTTMIDVLIRCNNLHVSSAAIEMLAKIGYFDAFGNIPEIMRILNLYDFFNKGTAKTVSKKKELAPELFDIVKKYATDRNAKGEELSSYTITSPEINKLKAELAELKKIYKKAPSELLEKEIAAKSEEVDFAICNHEAGMLREMEAYILSKGIEDLDYANKIQNQIDILGYVDLYSGKEEDRRKLFVEDIRPLKDKKKGDIWCYRIDTRSIGSGKTSSLTIPVESYKEYPIKKNDIISVPQGALKKNRKGYWYLYFYDKVYA